MKLDAFQRMCEHRWNCNQADLMSLSLTDDSYDELWLDVMLHPESPCTYKFFPGVVQNPITRTRVKISPGADQDSAHFHRKNSKCRCSDGSEYPVFLRRETGDV